MLSLLFSRNLFYHCFYENLFGTNPSKAFIQREDFFWALSILMSRATSGKNQPFTLIPFFDWFNHEGDLSKVNDACFHTFNEKEGFVVISNRAYTPGEQIFIHYGNHSNQKLLRNYGFTLPNNPLDTIHLELPKQIIQTRLAEPFGEAKRQILEVIGLEKHDTIHLTSKGITLESYKWIEILMARSFDELNHVLHNTSNTKKNNNSMNPHVNDLIQSLCKQRLEKYKTLYEMDASRLKQSQGQLATWLQACVHIRMGDQQMLRNVLRK
jgi:histone-lysine N-methyltransferase SETD3